MQITRILLSLSYFNDSIRTCTWLPQTSTSFVKMKIYKRNALSMLRDQVSSFLTSSIISSFLSPKESSYCSITLKKIHNVARVSSQAWQSIILIVSEISAPARADIKNTLHGFIFLFWLINDRTYCIIISSLCWHQHLVFDILCNLCNWPWWT